MPSAAALEHAGIPRDLPVVKVEISEGIVARLLMVGIVLIVVMLLSKSTGAFLQSRHRARAPLPCAMLGHHDMCAAASR